MTIHTNPDEKKEPHMSTQLRSKKTDYLASNERVKKAYYEYVIEAQGKSSSTLKGIIKSIRRFEEYTGFKDFKTFTRDQAVGFKKHLSKQKGIRSGENLSLNTVVIILRSVQDFFKWLALRPGYKSFIKTHDIAFLNVSQKEFKASKAEEYKPHPSLDQIKHVILSMPLETETQRRDRAMIAFMVLTGIRVGALISLKIKHVHLERNLVVQNPKEVNTKFSKQINTFFFPVGEDIRVIVVDWINELNTQKLYDSSGPLFPRTELKRDGNNSFVSGGLEPLHWQSSTGVRKILEKAFQEAGLSYYNPHSFRHTLVELGERICKTPEDFKAWSQNLGHESPLTTFTSYGTLSLQTQGRVMEELGQDPAPG